MAKVEASKAAEEVVVLVTITVPQMNSLGAHIAAYEAERLQLPNEGTIDMVGI
jgi:hypothetical protein